MVAGPCNHRNRTAGHAIPLAFQSLHRQGRGNHVRRHRAFVITSGRRAKNASDAAGRGWGALPTGHEGPGLDGFSWCPLVTLWGDMVNAESHVQGRCDCLPSPPGDMPYIVCAISCPYLLPARWTLPRPRASLPSTDSTSRVRSLSAWPRGWGAVLRSASFRNTVALRLHVIPTRYGSHLR